MHLKQSNVRNERFTILRQNIKTYRCWIWLMCFTNTDIQRMRLPYSKRHWLFVTINQLLFTILLLVISLLPSKAWFYFNRTNTYKLRAIDGLWTSDRLYRSYKSLSKKSWTPTKVWWFATTVICRTLSSKTSSQTRATAWKTEENSWRTSKIQRKARSVQSQSWSSSISLWRYKNSTSKSPNFSIW